MHTRNDWYVACTDADVTADHPFSSTVLGERLAIWRAADKVVAFEDRCVHRAAALSLGRCEGQNLRCMYHGLLFDAAGKVVDIPGQDVIPPNAQVRAYPVAVHYDWIWVWMGDPALADPAKLPTLFDGVDLDDYGVVNGELTFEANAQLISDNLLDFSHLPFVHAASFQAPLDWAKSPMTIKQLDNGVRFERWVENHTGFHFIESLSIGVNDTWMGYDYLVPGVLVMFVGCFPAGTARACDYGRPDFSKAIAQVSTNLQAITPVTEKRSHYYVFTGLHRAASGGGSDPAIVARNLEVTLQAFNEDKTMIEAQQQIIDGQPDRPFMPTVHDRGVTLYTRLKARLIAAETASHADAPLENAN
ncbi:aromatic ring-hydroxylating dioxygenase subunit alpha [Croceicoccus bisphenolivorans]|uniref:aromatic ring-hydroxylating dioxygenase subunit alpha n=1 Tax=Croceicoccus bisphenolivorans TaxID=1783232 RepID=UPI00083127F9|nr:aromatic ring-hydroxylating dioxygenase subunit alpha [Croceicoccus bisphenolivorans]